VQGRVAVDEMRGDRSGSGSVRMVFAVHVATWVSSHSLLGVRKLLGASIVEVVQDIYRSQSLAGSGCFHK
jgi:hypothetical protein